MGEAFWGSSAVFELLFSNNYKYSGTPSFSGDAYTGIPFSSSERLCSV